MLFDRCPSIWLQFELASRHAAFKCCIAGRFFDAVPLVRSGKPASPFYHSTCEDATLFDMPFLLRTKIKVEAFQRHRVNRSCWKLAQKMEIPPTAVGGWVQILPTKTSSLPNSAESHQRQLVDCSDPASRRFATNRRRTHRSFNVCSQAGSELSTNCRWWDSSKTFQVVCSRELNVSTNCRWWDSTLVQGR